MQKIRSGTPRTAAHLRISNFFVLIFPLSVWLASPGAFLTNNGWKKVTAILCFVKT